MEKLIQTEEEEIFYSPENERNAGVIICINEDEKTKLHLMRKILEKHDPSCKELNDLTTLRRFLRARDLDVEKASGMFMKYITWRREFVPKGFISPSEITNQLSHNKVYIQGTDKKGLPIGVMFGAKHFPCKGGTEEVQRMVVFTLDKICSRYHVLFSSLSPFIRNTLFVNARVRHIRLPDGQEKFTFILDLKGYGYANSDIRGYIAGLSILQDYYPERLGKVFIIHVPYIFMTMWKIISPFIDKNTKKKIIFVDNKNLQAALLEDIDEIQLPEIYGGKLQLVPVQEVS